MNKLPSEKSIVIDAVEFLLSMHSVFVVSQFETITLVNFPVLEPVKIVKQRFNLFVCILRKLNAILCLL